MEVLSHVSNSQEKVKNVFRQLLERLSLRKIGPPSPARALSISRKRHEQAKSRRLSAGLSFKSYYTPKQSPEVLPRNARCLNFSDKKGESQLGRRFPIKGSLSNRSKTDSSFTEYGLVEHKIQQYNQLLITKSYIFSELQHKRSKEMSKNSSPTRKQPWNFERSQKVPIKEFKRHRQFCRKQNHLDSREFVNKTQTKCLNDHNSASFEPWETKNTYDHQ